MKETTLGRPTKISRNDVAKTASEIGLENLKLAQVAKRLGVTLQTLYNHVRNREELVNLAADILEANYFTPIDDSLSWTDWWRESAKAMLAYYEKTPGFASILMQRPNTNIPRPTKNWEAIQRIAERDGFAPQDALWANMAVHEFVYSWAAKEDQLRKANDSAKLAAKATDPADQEADLDNFACVISASKLVSERPKEDRFEMTLNALLAGLLAQHCATK